MREWQRQSHVKWDCRYHVVIVPKYRQKAIFGKLRKDIGRILRELCEQFDIELIEGHAMPDHVHLGLSIPPKYSVATASDVSKGSQRFGFTGSTLAGSATLRDFISGQRAIV
jgi:putative transposase